MKALRICLALVIIAGVAFAQSHLVQHYVIKTVSSTAEADFPYKAWDIYNMAGPGDYLDHTSVGHEFFAAPTLFYYGFDTGNFGHPWVNGDTVCVIGSYNADAGLSTHAGYYWLFSDILNGTVDPDPWTPWDTLRIMAKPMVSQLHDTLPVIVEIENPYETDRTPWGTEEYDVLGYWIVLDSTGTGVESFFDVVLGFAPVTGGPGGSTFFEYYPNEYLPVLETYTTYHAYYIVARPETTTTPGVCPGFSTDYLSQNSDPLVVVGIAEYNDEVPASFSARPSVFTERTQFAVTLPEQALVNIKLYDAAGQLVATVCDEVMTAGAHTINFDGRALASGVYFYTLNTYKEQLSGQIVKLR